MSNERFFNQLLKCLYFSATIFTRTNFYSDLQLGDGFKAVAIIEGIMGWLTLALFLITLGNVWLG
ncbi:MAG TPA: hypothetical protein ACFYD2_10675 [Candidatus Avalokitesvara rifleensis]|uniref:hypothetical protein n=1 Tax=Candidatus Avalokitesvara rifleensis TaxID=3367620 RepID=UPI00402774C0